MAGDALCGRKLNRRQKPPLGAGPDKRSPRREGEELRVATGRARSLARVLRQVEEGVGRPVDLLVARLVARGAF